MQGRNEMVCGSGPTPQGPDAAAGSPACPPRCRGVGLAAGAAAQSLAASSRAQDTAGLGWASSRDLAQDSDGWRVAWPLGHIPPFPTTTHNSPTPCQAGNRSGLLSGKAWGPRAHGAWELSRPGGASCTLGTEAPERASAGPAQPGSTSGQAGGWRACPICLLSSCLSVTPRGRGSVCSRGCFGKEVL